MRAEMEDKFQKVLAKEAIVISKEKESRTKSKK
jgi:hypothetical protein